MKLNIEHATIRALNVTLNEDQAIDIDEERDEGQNEELDASSLYNILIENQKKQQLDKLYRQQIEEDERKSASILEKPVDSCYNLLEDDIIDKREI